MRTPVLALVLLWAVAGADETSVLRRAVERFRSQDADDRDAASKEVRFEVRRLLAPLLAALEDDDPEVRRRAREALETLLPRRIALPEPPAVVPSWHPWKATGKADAAAHQDHPNAWASKEGNMGLQWLELGYRQPRRVHTIRIFEVNRAGAVVRIEAVDEAGVRRTVWKGDDPTRTPGVFEVTIRPTAYRVRLVRLILDTNRASGWNEIDAVEIVGPNGRAWAASATASSTYASN
ncbi:MAG: hypothetical protein ACYTEZ_16135 [Planctomycetota bacterium]|jgi:hypothetical protein